MELKLEKTFNFHQRLIDKKIITKRKNCSYKVSLYIFLSIIKNVRNAQFCSNLIGFLQSNHF